MCNKILKSLIMCVLLLSSCIAQQSNTETGTIKGTIGIYEGNCMPGPGVKPCEPRPIATEILITSLSEKFDETKIIARLKSSDDGKYEARLSVGTYSLFLMDEGKSVCTLIQCPTTCFCHPFKIGADSTTIIDANLDHATW